MRLLIVNGPNLNLLGTREPEIYGSDTLADLEGRWRRHTSALGMGVTTFQSNHEGEIIDTIQSEGPRCDGIVINPGAFSHYSYAIHDALVAASVPTVEVHISNIHEREAWRRVSVTGAAAIRTIYGRGVGGYLDAINLLWATFVAPSMTETYGDQPDHIIDLRTPSDPRGLVVLLHGGFWRQHWARDTIDPLAAALSHEGWATANVEYRRGPAAFTMTTADVASAIEFLRDELDTDITERPVLLGHSAGAYLAIRAAQHDARLGGVIGLGSAIDLVGISESRSDDDPVEAWLGAPRDVAPDVWANATLDGPIDAPVRLIHGSADDTTPLEQAQAWASDRDDVVLTVVEGGTHMEVIDPRRDAFGVILTALEHQVR